MKKRFGRMLGILLTMVMLVGLMPATAMAADELTAITNVAATSDDLESIPKFNGLRKDPEIEVTEGKPAYFSLSMYRWERYDEEAESWITYNEPGRFAEAGEWRLSAQLRTDSSTHTLAKEGLNVTVNDEPWEVGKVNSGDSSYDGTPFSYVSVYSPAFALKDDGTEVTPVTALPLSVKGYELGADAEDVSVVTTAEGVEIEYFLLEDTNEDDNDSELDEDDLVPAEGELKAGVNYVIQAFPVPEDLYDITGLEEEDVTMTGAKLMLFVNQQLYGGPCFAVGLLPVLEADEDANVIKEFEATVTAPVAGAAPSWEVTVPEGKGYSGRMVYWYSMETGKEMQSSDVFEEGKTYKAEVVLIPASDKTAADDAEGTVNGKDAEVTVVNAGENRTVELKVLFKVPSSVIDVLEAKVTKPVAGATPSAATEDDDRYRVWYTDWVDVAADDYMEETDEFEAGKTYKVLITFTTESGFRFADDVTGKINGKAATDESYNVSENHYTVFAREFKVPAKSSGGSGSSVKKYPVNVEDTDNGAVESSRDEASKGTLVTITTDPEAGYGVDDITVTTKHGDEVEVTDKGNGEFTFRMPAAEVTVEVAFEETEGTGNGVEEYIRLTIDSVIAWVFDEYVTNDVPPVIRNERTMLPARFVAEALGGVVTWNEAEQKVTIVKDGSEIVIFIGEPFATVDGTPVELDCAAYIENDRTYLPIRFIAENLGAEVVWDAAARTVTITP